jgi:hypothetical protein
MGQSEFLRLLVETLERMGIAYQVTGAQATIAHGEPRFTNDIDVVADLRGSTWTVSPGRSPRPNST